MIYNDYTDIPDGIMYIIARPCTDGFELTFHAMNPSTINVHNGKIVKKVDDDKFNREPLTNIFLVSFIVGDSYESVMREKLRILNKIRYEKLYYAKLLVDGFDKQLADVNFFELLEQYPEVEI